MDHKHVTTKETYRRDSVPVQWNMDLSRCWQTTASHECLQHTPVTTTQFSGTWT